MTATPMIAFVRQTNCLTDDLVASYVRAQQAQLDQHFQHWYGLNAYCIVSKAGDPIPVDAWEVLLLDNSDEADALGYHDDTGPHGHPRAKVFVKDAIADGLSWTTSASHEVLEMLADPMIDKTVKIQVGPSHFEYAYEVCDAPEDDRYAYPILGHHMSAFVTPAWFDPDGNGQLTFTEVHLGFVTPPGHPLANQRSARFSACSGLSMVLPAPPLAVAQQVHVMAGATKAPMVIQVDSDNIQMISSLVQGGWGSAFCPHSMWQPRCAPGSWLLCPCRTRSSSR